MHISLRRVWLTALAAVCVLIPSGAGSSRLLSSHAVPQTRSRAMLLGAPGENCGAGKDMVVQALELLKADSSRNEIADADEHLKRAIDLCGESGEAWYYRSLVEEKLNHKPQSEFALRKAKMFPSDALVQGINPFILAAPKESKPLGPIQRRWALVVGIGEFQDTNIHPLEFSTSDATAFRDALLDTRNGGGFSPENVRLLKDGEATLRGIKEGMNWLARSAAPEDLAVIYIASHGSSRDMDTAGSNYIVTHDTEVGKEQNPDTLYSTALPMAEFATDIASRLKSRRTAVFIDTCYSGGAAAAGGKLLAPGVANAAVSKSALDQIRQGAGRVIFAASSSDQESLESKALQHGYFTYFLVQALHDHPDQPLSLIFASVQKQVSARVDADYRIYNRHQTPVMSRSDDHADFALGAAVAPMTTASLVR